MPFLKKAILSTLAYADIFDYPLTSEELYFFLIADKPLSYSAFKRALKQIRAEKKLIKANGGYFFLKEKEGIVAVRERREQWSKEKLEIARRVAGWLRLIPWIKMVAVTGALAMKNSDKEDDIDLFFITAKNRLWLSRGFITLLRFSGLYRRPDKVRDRICPNMFLDENHLQLPKEEQSLFTAHEICQLKPLWDKDGIYKKFLGENRWVERYLPNWGKDTKSAKSKKQKGSNFSIFPTLSRILDFAGTQFLNFWESVAYRFQLAYMRPRRTIEIVEPHRIRFHPQDRCGWVLRRYHRRVKKLSSILAF